MNLLHLHLLACNQTEAPVGADRCRLEGMTDGAVHPPLRRNLRSGQALRLELTFAFEQSASVKLSGHDGPDRGACLGEISLGPGIVDSTTERFAGGGAEYSLQFCVEELSNPGDERWHSSGKDLINCRAGKGLPTAAKPADWFQLMPKLMELSESRGRGAWPYISKPELLADIQSKVTNPFAVNQGSTPFCGPAAIVFEFVSREPFYYLLACGALFEEGEFKARTKTVRASQKLRKSHVKSGVSVADWMLMATLRESENELFEIDQTSGSFAAGPTTPWEMKGWASEILLLENCEFESTFVYGEFEAMQMADAARRAGGVAFPLVHTSLLTGSTSSLSPTYPEHWISYLGNLEIDDGVWWRWDSGNIGFDCYSWGKKLRINAHEDLFEDCMWGVVTGRE